MYDVEMPHGRIGRESALRCEILIPAVRPAFFSGKFAKGTR